MAPIRVGIIGLSTVVPGAAGYTPGTWGLVHLEAITQSPHYKIVALCNTSVESARKSIAFHKLDPETRAYGSPEDLARDPDVDLISVSVHVDKHYAVTKPALLNKKNVLVEFPVASNLAQVEELAQLAREHNLKTVVGAQARANPALRRVSELIKSKAIGDVVSSVWSSQLSAVSWLGWPEFMKESLDIDSGASIITIGFGHGLEAFLSVLGDFSVVQSVFKTQGKTTPLIGASGSVVDPAFKVTGPNQVLVQGVLESGAVVSLSLRISAGAADGVGHRWTIAGTKGELVFTSGPGFIQGLSAGSKVTVKKAGGGVEEIDLSDPEEPEHVRSSAANGINTARLYESFATDDADGYPTLEAALKVHQLLEKIKAGAVWAH